MTGIGTIKATEETRTIRTITTNSLANIFPKSQKLSDKSFTKKIKD